MLLLIIQILIQILLIICINIDAIINNRDIIIDVIIQNIDFNIDAIIKNIDININIIINNTIYKTKQITKRIFLDQCIFENNCYVSHISSCSELFTSFSQCNGQLLGMRLWIAELGFQSWSLYSLMLLEKVWIHLPQVWFKQQDFIGKNHCYSQK